MKREDFTPAFIAKLRSALGSRWVHQGRDPQHGVDCAGLVVWAAKECGANIEDRLDYQRRPEAHVLLGVLRRHCDSLPLSAREPGDLLVFQYADNPQHLAVLTSDTPPTICHSALRPGRVIETGFDEQMQARLRYVFRLKGFE